MRDFGRKTRLFGLACLLTLTIASVARSQTVGASPTDLSFGVPTVTPAPTSPQKSAPQNLTVNLTGSASITFTSVGVNPSGSKDYSADFVADPGTCTGMIDPTTTSSCQITVTFTASQAPATTLETATLVIQTNGTPGTINVPMNGAYGAIELFGALNTNPSTFQGVTWPNSPGNPVKTITLNLSCPTSPTAVLSSTPDGSGYLFQDNTITVSNAANGGAAIPTSNVCYGGDTNFEGYSGFPAGTSNCFQSSYETAAAGLLGNNPDLPLPQPNNGSIASIYGVPALNLQAASVSMNGAVISPYNPILQSGANSLSVQLTDAGGDLGASTVQLVTNCSPAGVTPGGSLTGNPVTSDPSSQTQTFTFDSAPGQNISITSSDVNSGVVNTSSVIPVITDFGIPQAQFYQLVEGTSAAPAVCLRLAGELDSMGNELCKGYLIQCNNGTTISGDNCVTGAAQFRTLFDYAKFSSPDAPVSAKLVNQSNFLTSVSCSHYLSYPNEPTPTPLPTCAAPNPAAGQLIGAGMLLGSDQWLTIGADGNYNVAQNCNFGNSGTLANNLCPLDTLTQFKGSADAGLGSTTTGRNSIFVPVVNMPLPYTQASINGQGSSGWQNNNSPTVNFVSSPATYPTTGGSLPPYSSQNPPPSIPPANGFKPAAIYGLTWGMTPFGTAIPDPTYPVPGDTTNLSPVANTKPGSFGPPACSAPYPPAPPNNPSFSSTATFPGELADGIYNVHYFATDCAFTEELVFNPTSAQLQSATANWASFEVFPFGVDTKAPVLTGSSCTQTPAAPAFGIWYAGNVTETCSWNDPQSSSGFASGFATDGLGTAPSDYPQAIPNEPGMLQGPLTTVTSSSTGITGPVAGLFPISSQSVTDLAGNPSATVNFASVNVDTQPPTITGVSSPVTLTVNGTGTTVSFTCSDGTGSGIKTCSATGLPVSYSCTTTLNGETANCTSATITPVPGNEGNYPITISATDNVGNAATPAATDVNIVYSSTKANVLFAELPTLAIPGQKLQVFIAAADFSPAKTPTAVYGAVANITLSLPSGTLATNGTATAMYGTVNCSSFPCTDTPSSGPACSVSTTPGSSGSTTVNVSCPLGTLNDAYTTRTGDMIVITLPISTKAVFGKLITTNGKLTALSNIGGTTSFNTPILIF